MTDRITLRAEGLMLERFVNRALAQGACFQRIARESRRRMLLVTDAPGAEILLELAEKYHLNCAVVRKSGLHAALDRARKRLTLIAALLVCILCTALFLSRVWIIDVQFAGDRPLTGEKESLQNALSALGIRPGISRGAIDPDALALELGAQSENYSFIGVRLLGVRLLVEASPEVEAPELYDIDYARDLVAACDGVIVSVNAQSGKALVAPGDTVRKGQVLISGEERVTNEASRGVSALGEVIARTWFTAEAEGALTECQRRFTGRESASSTLRLLDWQIPLSEGETFSLAETATEQLPVGGMFLPLVIERVTQREYEESIVPVDETALKNALEAEALALAEQKMQAETGGACQIIDKWADYSKIDSDRLRVRAVLEVQRNIAATRDSLYQGGN